METVLTPSSGHHNYTRTKFVFHPLGGVGVGVPVDRSTSHSLRNRSQAVAATATATTTVADALVRCQNSPSASILTSLRLACGQLIVKFRKISFDFDYLDCFRGLVNFVSRISLASMNSVV